MSVVPQHIVTLLVLFTSCIYNVSCVWIACVEDMHHFVYVALVLLAAFHGASARGRPNLANVRVPAEMKEEIATVSQKRSMENFVASYQDTGYFEHTDVSFAPYLAAHPRFFTLFYAKFSEVCVEFLSGFKEAAKTLTAEGFKVNFTVSY